MLDAGNSEDFTWCSSVYLFLPAGSGSSVRCLTRMLDGEVSLPVGLRGWGFDPRAGCLRWLGGNWMPRFANWTELFGAGQWLECPQRERWLNDIDWGEFNGPEIL